MNFTVVYPLTVACRWLNRVPSRLATGCCQLLHQGATTRRSLKVSITITLSRSSLRQLALVTIKFTLFFVREVLRFALRLSR